MGATPVVTEAPAAVGTGGLVQGGLQPLSSFAPGNAGVGAAPFANNTGSATLASLQPLGSGGIAAPTGGLPGGPTDSASLRPLPGSPEFNQGGAGGSSAAIPGGDPNAAIPSADATGALNSLPGAPSLGLGGSTGGIVAPASTGALVPGLAPTGATPSGLTTVVTTNAAGATVTTALPLNAAQATGAANGGVTPGSGAGLGVKVQWVAVMVGVVVGALGVLVV